MIERIRGLRRFSRRFAPPLMTAPGASPGTLVVEPGASATRIEIYAYDADHIEHRQLASAAEIGPWIGRYAVLWVNVAGLGDPDVLSEIAAMLGLHRLALEDVVNVHQRPKVEEYGELLFVVTRMPREGAPIETEQVSLVLGNRLLLSFQEHAGDCLGQVRQRLMKPVGKIRTAGPDYLAYAILDAITDAFFPVMESFGERLERIEDETLASPGPSTIAEIHGVKRELLQLRRVVWPKREMLSALCREDSPLLTASTHVYLRDCYDHAVQLIDVLENFREIASGLTDVYLSSASQRMNEIMKVLTIISTIFIPLTFIAGVYGMNFDRQGSPFNMPELGWYLGYPLCLLLMAIIAISLVFFFRRKGWLGKR